MIFASDFFNVCHHIIARISIHIFCFRNAAEYEKAVVSEAKYQVAFEVMNYQAAASEVEAHHLAEQQRDSLPAASTFNIDTFAFDYLTLNDSDTLKVKAP